METQTSTTPETEPTPADGQAQNGAAGLSDRIKDRARLVRAQLDAAEARARKTWQEAPVRLRDAAKQAFGKVRDGLDLPSRREVNELVRRIDELDRKLAEYESRKAR
ncbi:MAG TPA: hypothetical protein VKZ63_19825 [Kofleriaceae bacterium]|nr:hypothetical protein [Kofleriaceae bacterium]